MMRDRVQELRYGVGDVMGRYAPDYFHRPTNGRNGILIGAASVLAAVGVGFLATRISNQRIGRLIDRIAHKQGMAANRDRRRMQEAPGRPGVERAQHSETRTRTARPAVHESDGSNWPKPEPGPRS